MKRFLIGCACYLACLTVVWGAGGSRGHALKTDQVSHSGVALDTYLTALDAVASSNTAVIATNRAIYNTNLATTTNNFRTVNDNIFLTTNLFGFVVQALGLTGADAAGWNSWIQAIEKMDTAYTTLPTNLNLSPTSVLAPLQTNITAITNWAAGTTTPAGWLDVSALSSNFTQLNIDFGTVNTNFAAVSNDFVALQGVVNSNAAVVVTNAVAHNYNFTNVLYNLFDDMFAGVPGWNSATFLASIAPASTNVAYTAPGSLGSYAGLTNWYATEFTNTVQPFVSTAIGAGGASAAYWGWTYTNQLDNAEHAHVVVADTDAGVQQPFAIPTNGTYSTYAAYGTGVTNEIGFGGLDGVTGIRISEPGSYAVVADLRVFDITGEYETNVTDQPVGSYRLDFYTDNNVPANIWYNILNTMPYDLQPFSVADPLNPDVLAGYYGNLATFINITAANFTDPTPDTAWLSLRPTIVRYTRNGGTTNLDHVVRSMRLNVYRVPSYEY